jgi:hypothetical protein
LDATVAFLSGESQLEVPLLGDAKRRSVAAVLLTSLFFVQLPPTITRAVEGVTVVSAPKFFEVIVIGTDGP